MVKQVLLLKLVSEWTAGIPDTVSYGEPGSWTYCPSQQAIWAQSWMNIYNTWHGLH